MEIPEGAIAIWDERHGLANFGPIMVTTRGGQDSFKTSEHLYQMTKFMPSEKEIREAIKDAETPGEAKRIAHKNKKRIRKDWEGLRKKVMMGVMRLKIRQNLELQTELLGTGDRFIYEDADQYAPESPTIGQIAELRRWGIYRGEGENWIGEILMSLRSELQTEGKV